MNMNSLFAKMNPLNWFKKKNRPIITYKIGEIDSDGFTDVHVYENNVFKHTVKTLLFPSAINLEKNNCLHGKN